VRAAPFVMAMSVALLGVSAGAQPGPSATGFDHLDHQTKVTVSAAPEPTCTTCHRLDGRGRPRGYDHKTCFSGCHGGLEGGSPQQPTNQSERAVCLVCHPPSSSTAPTGTRPARAETPHSDPEHAIHMSHASHASERCESCHRPQTNAPSQLHSRCRSCHERRSAPTFDQCEGCHIGQVGQQGPTLERHLLSVAPKFDHKRHRAKSTAGCRDCHASIVTQKEDRLPPPRKSDCAKCHDGRKAFDTIGPSCTRCHAAPATPFEGVIAAATFDHQLHRKPCTTCHTLESDGSPVFAKTVHESCAPCHSDEFSAPRPVICTTCHIAAEPWRPLHVERRQRKGSAFSTRFDHLAHGAPADCQRCHPRLAGVAAPALHSGCATPECHRHSGGPAPELEQCTGCHVDGNATATSKRQWSVAATFSHQRHLRDPRTQRALPCSRCHTGQPGPNTRMPAPAEASCAPCHDGKTAFSITGHDCRKCHR